MKKLLLTFAFVSMLTGVATADVLWDQSNYDSVEFWEGFVNSQSGCVDNFNGKTSYTAVDVTFAELVTINSITNYYQLLSEFGDPTYTQPGDAVEANLWIYPRTGLPVYPADDPTAGTLVPVTATNIGDAWAITASGLSISLAAGDYWVALTPVFDPAPGGFNGPFPAMHLRSFDYVGINSAYIEVCGWNNPPFWSNPIPNDAAILIEGTPGGPVATENETWGGLKASYR